MCNNRISAFLPTFKISTDLDGRSIKRPAQTAYRLVGFLLLCITSVMTSTASFADAETPSNKVLEAQIEFIDQEILLLRAELALTNRDIPALKRYLRQLDGLTLAPVFSERLIALERSLSSMSSTLAGLEQGEFGGLSDSTSFKLPAEGGQVVILLPLSGDYDVAGQAILESLQSAWPFSKTFTVIDSGLYPSMYELWELVKLYQPDFIVGPLTKDNVLAWQALDVRIPTLYLNQLDTYKANEKGLSPNKVLGLLQLNAFADSLGLENVLVLTEPTESSKELQSQFEREWFHRNSHAVYETRSTEKSVHQSMQAALNVNDSYARKHWVQNTVGAELEFEPRARQDIEAVIAFSPMSDAVQIKPILNFYHLNRTMSLWYPTIYPTADELQSQQSYWQKTYAFLPPYLTTSTNLSDHEKQSDIKTGLFYALGLLVAETVKNPRLSLFNQNMTESALGTLITNKEGHLTILPHVFWLDDKQIQPVHEYQYSFE